MMRSADRSTIEKILGWTALFATLVVTPWAAYDPINVPKLAVISIGGIAAFCGLMAVGGISRQKQMWPILLLMAAFVVNLTIVLFVSGTNFSQSFFGTFGRATGYVAYIALAALLVVAAQIANPDTLKRISNYLLLAGLLSLIYGVIQVFNLDPFKWANEYTPVIGFLGNPNFQSSFLGFSGVMAFALMIGSGRTWSIRFALFVFILATGIVIRETESQQGILVLLGGIAMIVCMWIPRSRFKFLSIPTYAVGLIGVILVALGSLNKGPLASLLFKDSVTYRGDYWRAGWKMSLENPIFGVGLDSYGDWYRRTRTIEATLRRGPDVTSNAAHNVLLDFSSNGGFPLLIIYLLMILLVVISIVRVLKRSAAFDPMLSGLVAVWIAYQAQSIISLNQLGLAVWGWIISGLIIGYEINTRDTPKVSSEEVALKKKSGYKANRKDSSPRIVIGITSGLLIGSLLGLPPLISSTHFKSALESGDPERIEQTATYAPASCQHVLLVASIFANNKLEDRALSVLNAGITKSPDCFEIWKAIYQLSAPDSGERATAQANMKRLDPNNPDIG
jgi:O-antigen ligase